MKPVIAVTMGDPAGIGPEIALKALSDRRILRAATPLLIGDRGLLEYLGKKLSRKLPPFIRSVSSIDLKALGPGRPTAESSRAMIGYVTEAVKMASSGEASAIVTGPISKEAARLAGFAFPGHTEYIAHLTNARDFRMMLGGRDLKVILVTIHEPIKKVPRLITRGGVYKTIKITDESFRRFFGIKKPRIAVAGLNPHAGEAGMFGDEEAKAILPAVKKARREGIDAVGPLPPDTVFYRAVKRKEFDCVVCMYHDQGLGPLKLLHFEDGINATLGLPIIRTSVDHGTAYDIAWKGVASEKSLVSAIETAVEMSLRGKKR